MSHLLTQNELDNENSFSEKKQLEEAAYKLAQAIDTVVAWSRDEIAYIVNNALDLQGADFFLQPKDTKVPEK